MILKKSSAPRKYYLKELKKNILDFEVQFKKRYKLFPWDNIYKIDKLKFKKEVPIKVDGKNYSIKELITKLKKIDKDLKAKVKPSYFNIVTSSFMSESKNKSVLDVKKIFDEHNKEVKHAFYIMKKDLEFALHSLKAITAYLKTQRIKGYIMESEDNTMQYKSIYEEFGATELEVKDTILQIHELYDDIIDCVEDEEFTEGVNLDSRKELRAAMKQIKADKKRVKQLIANHDYAEARKICNHMKVVLNNLSKKIDDLEGGVGSAIIGAILSGIVTGCLVIIPVAGPFIAIYREVRDFLGTINAITKDVKTKGEVSTDSVNVYRNSIKQKISDTGKIVDKTIKTIDKMEAEYKSAEAMSARENKVAKENAEYESKRLSIYEACQNGEITVSEREELLDDLRMSLLFTESTAEATEAPEYYTRGELFDRVRQELYVKCESGDISIEEREDLIDRAKSKIFGEDANDAATGDDSGNAGKEADKQDSQIEKASAEADKKIEAEANKLEK